MIFINLLALVGTLAISSAPGSTLINANINHKIENLALEHSKGHYYTEEDMRHQEESWWDSIRQIDYDVTKQLDNAITNKKNDFKKPNTWENFIYDIIKANGFDPSKFNSTTMKKNIDLIREFFLVRDSDLSSKLGSLYHGNKTVISDKLYSTTSTKYSNSFSNRSINVTTPAKTIQIESETSTKLEVGFSASYSSKIDIGFVKEGVEFKFNTSLGFETKKKTTDSVIFNPVTFELPPKSIAYVDMNIWDTFYQINEGVRYDIYNKNYPLIYLYSIDNGRYPIQIAETMAVIAQYGMENYFTENSNDLFINTYEHNSWMLPNSIYSYHWLKLNLPLITRIHGYNGEYEFRD